jgi:hypothetical protein
MHAETLLSNPVEELYLEDAISVSKRHVFRNVKDVLQQLLHRTGRFVAPQFERE